jgi:hypothetical protein
MCMCRTLALGCSLSKNLEVSRKAKEKERFLSRASYHFMSCVFFLWGWKDGMGEHQSSGHKLRVRGTPPSSSTCPSTGMCFGLVT